MAGKGIFMKIISWNCNGAFRRKYPLLEADKADIWVVQECESPEYLKSREIPLPTEDIVWCGKRSCKGLGIFAFNGYKLQRADFYNPEFQYILPVNIISPDGKKFLLVGIWTTLVKENRDYDYIGQVCAFLRQDAQNFDEKTILCGDFNCNMQANSFFKKEHNYERFLELLEHNNMECLYHRLTEDPQGEEKLPTSYFHRKPGKVYHVDYFVLNKKNAAQMKICGIPVDADVHFDYGKWLEYSDHFPLTCETEL